MTGEQLALDVCDPTWSDLADHTLAALYDPHDPRWRDLRGQGLTAWEIHRMTTVTTVGSYL
ncbi:hypothetical protein ABZ915_17560 [Streptomyces sp. NPDC046915]|uniref:hypothetical protein n=1 Tax=Streptomyces sp. NPDC046915 TaxID=3155257 RepID=UPI00340508ED